MKTLLKNQFDTNEAAIAMLDKVQEKFGGCGQCNDADEIFAVTDCNGFETVDISYDEYSEVYRLNVTSCFYDRGEEIMKFIEENNN